MNQFLYETHLHTKEASACSVSWAREYIAAYRNIGYSGIIVTDHFFNGNSSISRSLPWEERVAQFCIGYEHAKKEGDRQGLSVFFGWEHSFGNDEYLIYGLDKEWLLNHPQVMEWNHRELFEAVDRAGGLMIQAHPFRERFYLDSIKLHPSTVHGIEAVNAENEYEHDRKAYAYAQRYDLAMTSGSDIHSVLKVGPTCKGMAFNQCLASIQDFVDALKSRSGYVLIGEGERFSKPQEPDTGIPIYLYETEQKAQRIAFQHLSCEHIDHT